MIAQERWSRIVGLSYEELVKGLRSLEDAEKQDQPPPSDKRLLKNIDTLNPAVPSAKPLPAIDKLEAELASLWDWEEQGKRPLNPEVVFSAVNGYKTEGIYINGYGDADGQDRVFFYYSRPESGDKKAALHRSDRRRRGRPQHVDCENVSVRRHRHRVAGLQKQVQLEVGGGETRLDEGDHQPQEQHGLPLDLRNPQGH